MSRKLRIVALLFVFAIPHAARAWGRSGHAIVADIAQDHLTPAAYSAASLLLEEEGLTQLAEVSSWADDFRKSHPETAPWHFVDIPLNAQTYNAARDCPAGDCAVAKLEQFRAILADQSAPAAQRLEALKWIVHLVADLHQPLHAEDNGDRGGNQIIAEGFDRPVSLHAIWDTTLIEQDNADPTEFAATLDARITPADIADRNQGTPVDWLNQAHLLAEPAYAMLGDPAAGSSVAIPDSYVDAEQKVIDVQLERAGVRLAEVLNQALK